MIQSQRTIPGNPSAATDSAVGVANLTDQISERAAGTSGIGRPATIYDVARLAGVSPTTVSHVVNRSRRVQRATRARVEEAIAALGFRRNALARGLRQRGIRTIGLVLSDITNPFYTAVARGAEDAASAAGYGVILCNTDERGDKQRTYVQMLMEHRVAGILIVPVTGTDAEVAALVQEGLPVVVLNRDVAGGQTLDTVRLDDGGGARAAVEHFLAHGHCRIAAVLGQPGAATTARRLDGYRQALRAAGIAPDPTLEVPGGGRFEGAHAAAAALVEAGAEFTAVLGFNAPTTLGILAALRERGRRVPHDVSVIGFGDADWMHAYNPPITAVAQPTYELGGRGAAVLLQRVAEAERRADEAIGVVEESGAAEVPAPSTIQLPTELIIRESVASRLSRA